MLSLACVKVHHAIWLVVISSMILRVLQTCFGFACQYEIITHVHHSSIAQLKRSAPPLYANYTWWCSWPVTTHTIGNMYTGTLRCVLYRGCHTFTACCLCCYVLRFESTMCMASQVCCSLYHGLHHTVHICTCLMRSYNAAGVTGRNWQHWVKLCIAMTAEHYPALMHESVQTDAWICPEVQTVKVVL